MADYIDIIYQRSLGVYSENLFQSLLDLREKQAAVEKEVSLAGSLSSPLAIEDCIRTADYKEAEKYAMLAAFCKVKGLPIHSKQCLAIARTIDDMLKEKKC